MIFLSIRRLKEDHVEAVTEWLTEVNTSRRDEAIQTLIAEGVRHETATILRTGDGKFIVYAMETDDAEHARAVGAASTAEIDRRHHEVMGAADAGRPDITKVLSIYPES